MNIEPITELRRNFERPFEPRAIGAPPRRVIIESPYAGDIERNVRYARAALRDALMRGEAPYASHLLYTQDHVLDDGNPHERQTGMRAGFAWIAVAEGSAIYIDLGVSSGMRVGLSRARTAGLPIEFRSIPDWEDVWTRVAHVVHHHDSGNPRPRIESRAYEGPDSREGPRSARPARVASQPSMPVARPARGTR